MRAADDFSVVSVPTSAPRCAILSLVWSRHTNFAATVQGVVHELEVVEVHEHHGYLGAPASRASEGAGEVLVERRLVVKIGEGGRGWPCTPTALPTPSFGPPKATAITGRRESR